ncbi:unnamed protein product [Sphagnum jensenii]|uniref:Uncharacterized protein n=1 Tax=Sphagnum jensenii TaxID=128206 RepID=A0ABP1BN56_9BRYO
MPSAGPRGSALRDDAALGLQSRAKVFFRLSSLLEFLSLRSVTKADRRHHLKSQPVGDDRGKDNQLSTHHQT